MRTDLINIGLIILSLCLAFVAPFHLFLFAYAVLGPLHYLTEVQWLHRRKYFLNQPKQVLLLLACATLIFLAALGIPAFASWGTPLVFLAFTSAFIFSFLHKPIPQGLALILCGGFAWFWKDSPVVIILFGVLLTTIIHVFVFTGMFMVYGALKQRQFWGFVAVGVFISAAVISILGGFPPLYLPSELVQQTYGHFQTLNIELLRVLQLPLENGTQGVFTSTHGIAVMRFIAFAYTYHYLNWFSKTRVIGWSDMPKSRAFVIVLLWILLLSIYAYDYRLGFLSSLLLSIGHVFLEFPLNHQTFTGIIKAIRIY